jgi:hypothetical protein
MLTNTGARSLLRRKGIRFTSLEKTLKQNDLAAN